MSTPGEAAASAVRILVIDDEPLLRSLVHARLSKDRHEVVLAASGDEGLRILEEQPFDLILVDAVMPGRSGLDVITQVQAGEHPPPIILMSAARREDLIVDALRLGVFDFISKDEGLDFVSTKLPELVARALREGRTPADPQERLRRQELLIDRLKRRARESFTLFQLEQALVNNRDQLHVAARAIADVVPHLLAHGSGGEVRVRLIDAVVCSPGYPAGGGRREYPILYEKKDLGSIELSFKPDADMTLAVPRDVDDLLLLIVARARVYLGRYQAERTVAAYHDELEMLDLAVSQISNPVVITNARLQIEYVNEAFLRTTGYTRAEVMLRNPKDLVRSNQMPESVYSEMRESLAAGRVWSGELINRKKNGELYWCEITISPLRQAGGRVTHHVAVVQDITARKRAEQLHHSVLGITATLAGCPTPDEIFRTVVESVRKEFQIDRCGLFLGDPEREALRGTFGTDAAGQTVDEHEHAWDLRRDDRILEALRRHPDEIVLALDPPPAPPCRALVLLRSANRPFGVLSVDNQRSGRPIDRAVLSHISLLSETVAAATLRAQAREQLRDIIRELQEKNASLEEFGRVASHDLQEPLRKIENFAGLLMEDYAPKLDATAREYLRIMEDGAQRMRRLIKDVLAYARAGSAEQSYERVDLNQVLRLVKDNLSVMIREKRAEVTVRPLPTLLAAETQMVQLFQNLVANGLKYNRSEKPSVEVWGEGTAAGWTFFVRDNGIGIDAEHSEVIFAPFRRLHGKGEFEGSGVGLASCRRIVSRHGGEIGVESAAGKGSTFWFTLPRTPHETRSGTEQDLGTA